MFTLELKESIVIHRPIAEVFAYMDDIDREHEWQPYLVRWEKSTEQNEVGTVRTYHNKYMGRAFTNVYEITEYQRNRKVMYKSTPAAAVQADGGTLWEAVGDGTKVTFLFTPKLDDFWGLLPKSLVRRMYMGTLTNNMKRLKKILETGELPQ